MANTKISGLTSATTPLAGTEVLPVVQSSTTKQVSVSNLTAGRAVAGTSFSATTFVSGLAPRQNPNNSGTTVDYAVRAADNAGGVELDFGISNVPSVYTAWMQVRSQSDFSINSYALAIQPNGGPVVVGSMTTPLSTTVLGITGGNIQFSTAAKGVNFTANTPAAGMTSQLLNWYEEGTWTPTFTSWSTAPTSIISATYTRIGRQVTLRFTAYQGNCAAQNIGGLPFTASGDSVAMMRDLNGGTKWSMGVTRNATTTVISNLAVDFTGLYWAFSTTHFV